VSPGIRDRAASLVAERFGADAQVEGDPDLIVWVPAARWVEAARFAKETLGCRFFSYSTAVDWKEQGLEVVARVENLDDGLAVTLKTRLDSGVSACPSLVPVYRGADWMERECYDMFGIRFDGHPDMRRILMWDEYPHFPLRKDFPLAGIETELPDDEVAAETKEKVRPAPMAGGPFVAPQESHMSQREPRARDESWNEKKPKP
jgi:NADH-quinone oxidoreductase subunit C